MKFTLSILAMTALLLESAGTVQAQQDSAMQRIGQPGATEARDCLPISQIRRIQTVDDNTLLFHMRGSAKYVNHLPQTCHGLKRHSFVHRTPMNSYCSMDIITVVDMMSGMQLGSCALGKFETVMDASTPD